MMNANFALDVH
jgi:hypothetical protein